MRAGWEERAAAQSSAAEKAVNKDSEEEEEVSSDRILRSFSREFMKFIQQFTDSAISQVILFSHIIAKYSPDLNCNRTASKNAFQRLFSHYQFRIQRQYGRLPACALRP